MSCYEAKYIGRIRKCQSPKAILLIEERNYFIYNKKNSGIVVFPKHIGIVSDYRERKGNFVMNLETLCKKINIPDEISEAVLTFAGQFDFSRIQHFMEQLFSRETWDEGLAGIKKHLGEDPDGVKILTCMLQDGLKTYENYRMLGISEQIYIDTMKCFSRFINEHKESYGTFGFDREWWTARQISAQLLRIGELEYEMAEDAGRKYISLHIPSDAVLQEEKIRESYHAAKRLIKEVFPEYAPAEMTCHSWLLSPTLNEVLDENSRILAFQKLFDIEPTGRKETDHMQWVFKNPKLPLEDLPEQTSLQRKLKQYLLQGGTVLEAKGRLLENLIPSSCGNEDSGIPGV